MLHDPILLSFHSMLHFSDSPPLLCCLLSASKSSLQVPKRRTGGSQCFPTFPQRAAHLSAWRRKAESWEALPISHSPPRAAHRWRSCRVPGSRRALCHQRSTARVLSPPYSPASLSAHCLNQVRRKFSSDAAGGEEKNEFLPTQDVFSTVFNRVCILSQKVRTSF